MSRTKYVRCGKGWNNCPIMYTIVMNQNYYYGWLVEVFHADSSGSAVSDALEWCAFGNWFGAKCYMWKKYKEYTALVNRRY